MSNFFNAIGVADMEKVHSAMIAWIFDDKNDSKTTESKFSTVDRKTRSELLCNMFGVSPKIFKSIKTDVEWNDIDILISTIDSQGTEERWIIENKLKSQEHKSNVKGSTPIWQTQKYTEIIQEYRESNNHYLLLSLTGEQAKSPIGSWGTIKYEELSDILSSHLVSASPIIEEYCNSIIELSQSLKNFLDKYKDYPHVMCGKMKKDAKSQADWNAFSPNEKYIIENGLETIFQKCLLMTQMEQYKENKDCHDLNYSISETQGIALLDINLGELVNEQQVYHVRAQFQNGSFKVQIHQIDENGTWEREQKDFLDDWKDIFYEIANADWKVNPPKSKNRPYISISKKYKEWYNRDIQDLLDKGFKGCYCIREQLISKFNEKNHSSIECKINTEPAVDSSL